MNFIKNETILIGDSLIILSYGIEKIGSRWFCKNYEFDIVVGYSDINVESSIRNGEQMISKKLYNLYKKGNNILIEKLNNKNIKHYNMNV